VSEDSPAVDAEQPSSEAGTTGTSTATGAELSDEALASGTSGDATAFNIGPADPDSVASAAVAEGSEFQAELVRALQATAALERVRIADETERRREAHIEQVRAREASEAERMRELADEDMQAIAAWADGETNRIQTERERREAALREDLEKSLAEHRSMIDTEIAGIEATIATYRAEIDAFFADLDRETDLVQIAQQATRRPAFPTLEVVAEGVGGASRPSGAETEPATAESPPSGPGGPAGAVAAAASASDLVGVMDPLAAGESVESWATPSEASPSLTPAGTSEGLGQGVEARQPAEPMAAATPRNGTSGGLLESVPVLRPMSWLRRDANGDDRSTREG
jgi:hypothetical protein